MIKALNNIILDDHLFWFPPYYMYMYIQMGLTENVDSANHEADPAGVPAGIRIKDLTKVYKVS